MKQSYGLISLMALGSVYTGLTILIASEVLVLTVLSVMSLLIGGVAYGTRLLDPRWLIEKGLLRLSERQKGRTNSTTSIIRQKRTINGSE